MADPQRTCAAALESFTVAKEHGLYQALGTLLVTISDQMLKRGQLEKGVQLLGAVRAAERAGSVELEARYQQEIECIRARMGEAHGADEVERIYRVGSVLTLDEAVALARDFCRKHTA